MDLSASDARYSAEDAFGIAGSQVLGVVAAVLSGVLCGVHYVGATMEYGIPARIPYGGLFSIAIGGLALFQAVGLVTRFREVWTESQARGRILLGLAQIVATAAIFALIGFFLAGRWIDLTTPGQSIVTWVYYGLVIGGVLHATIAAAGFVFLIANRDLPEIGD